MYLTAVYLFISLSCASSPSNLRSIYTRCAVVGTNQVPHEFPHNLLKVLKLLASGVGVRVRNWPEEIQFFNTDESFTCASKNFDANKILCEAKNFMSEYGRDRQEGWQLDYPLKKFRYFQSWKLET